MLLSDLERDFLASFIYEATTDPFKGPATSELHRRDIFYTDLPHLLNAYYQEGHPDQQGFGGKQEPMPPACPWPDRESALRRNREVEAQLGQIAKEAVSPG